MKLAELVLTDQSYTLAIGTRCCSATWVGCTSSNDSYSVTVIRGNFVALLRATETHTHTSATTPVPLLKKRIAAGAIVTLKLGEFF